MKPETHKQRKQTLGGQAEGEDRTEKPERGRGRQGLKVVIHLRQAQTHTLKLWRMELPGIIHFMWKCVWAAHALQSGVYGCGNVITVEAYWFVDFSTTKPRDKVIKLFTNRWDAQSVVHSDVWVHVVVSQERGLYEPHTQTGEPDCLQREGLRSDKGYQTSFITWQGTAGRNKYRREAALDSLSVL